MKIIQGLESVEQCPKGCVAALGTFDGVHLGHQRVIHLAVEEAARKQVPSLVITFDPPPRSFFHSEEACLILTTLEHKLMLISREGADSTLVIHFDRKFCSMAADDFVREILSVRLGISALVVGFNYSFGKGRSSGVEMLKKLCAEEGIELVVCDPVTVEDEIVSSTGIRRSVEQADLDKANLLLGRPYSLYGGVVTGRGIGARLGFPTANLDLPLEFTPQTGVYLVCTLVKEDGMYFGIANVGTRPTIPHPDEKPVVEVHLFEFEGGLYQTRMEVFFLKKIREEMKFANLEALREQIREDEKTAKKLLKTKQG